MNWFKELTWFKKTLVVIGILILGNFAWQGISSLLVNEHVDGITEEFTPMHNALENASSTEKQYDLEETIRIIHAIEYARDHSDDFSGIPNIHGRAGLQHGGPRCD